MINFNENTPMSVISDAIEKFETAKLERLGSYQHGRGYHTRLISYIVSLGQGNPGNPLVLNSVRAKLELEVRETIEALNQDPLISNIKRYYKENWGTCVIFDRKGKTYMSNSFDKETKKFEIYVHNPNEYSLSRANIKINC